MNDIECPYCGNDFELNHDDGAYYDGSNNEKCECPECEKLFMVESYCSWNHTGYKADCLNGEDHKWTKLVTSRPGDWRICEWCDERELARAA